MQRTGRRFMPQIVVFPNSHFCELQLVELTGEVVRVFML